MMHRFLLQIVQQFEALTDALRVLGLLFGYALLDMLQVVTLQEIALDLKAVIKVCQILDEVMYCL